MIVARPVGIAVDVGVEQVERDAPDLRAPHLHAHGHERAGVVGELDDRARLLELKRQQRRVVGRIALDLPAGLVELLAEVALAVEEADATSGMPRSDADFRWSPASTPRPPE